MKNIVFLPVRLFYEKKREQDNKHMRNKKKMKASTLIVIVFLAVVLLVAGTAAAVHFTSNKTKKDSAATGTNQSGTLSPTPAGTLGDGFAVNAAYSYECSGPLFAYNKGQNSLLAYCYADGSSHSPYNLSDNADATGKTNKFYIPEFDTTVYYRRDLIANVWRIYRLDPDSTEAAQVNTPVEYYIYKDSEEILTYAAHLRRLNEAALLTPPGYRTIKEDLFFQAAAVENDLDNDGVVDYYTSGGVEMTLDMDGDGYEELFKVVPKGSGYDVRINGVNILEEKKLIFSGIDVIDIDSKDTFTEVVCNYKDEFGFPVKSVIIRFDDGTVNTLDTALLLASTGNGLIQILSNDIFMDTQAIYEQRLSNSFQVFTSDKKYAIDRNVTAIKDVGIKFITDGKSTDGVLASGTAITIYQVDYVSKAYFRTADGREGILAVNGKNVGAEGIYFYRCFEDTDS